MTLPQLNDILKHLTDNYKEDIIRTKEIKAIRVVSLNEVELDWNDLKDTDPIPVHFEIVNLPKGGGIN